MMHYYAIKALCVVYDERFPATSDYAEDYKESVFYNEHKYAIGAVTEVNHYFNGHPMLFGYHGNTYDLYWNNQKIFSGDLPQIKAYCKGFINAHCLHLLKG